MPKFTSKPFSVEAFQLPRRDDFDVEPFLQWAEAVGLTEYESGRDQALIIHTSGEALEALPGDWIVKYQPGVFATYPPALFAERFEPAKP